MVRDYDAVLGTVPGESLKKYCQILKPKSTVISLVGPPDAAFGRTRGMNSLVLFVLWSLSRKAVTCIASPKNEVSSIHFLFVHPDGGQLAEISELLKVGIIRPVIDQVFPFDQAKEALAYIEKGRAKGRSSCRLGEPVNETKRRHLQFK